MILIVASPVLQIFLNIYGVVESHISILGLSAWERPEFEYQQCCGKLDKE